MLSIIIPTLNEEKNISYTIKKLIRIFKNINFEIIIVDDGSTDNTINEARLFIPSTKIKIISNTKSKGLGNAILQGHQLATGEYIMFLDADLSIKEEDILKLYNSRISNGMVVGSRYLPCSEIVNASKKKVLLSKFLNFLISKFFKIPIIDISHSFRILHINLPLKSKNLKHPGFFWEITLFLTLKNFRISEIPVNFIERQYGSSKNNSTKMLFSVARSIQNLIELKKFEKKK